MPHGLADPVTNAALIVAPEVVYSPIVLGKSVDDEQVATDTARLSGLAQSRDKRRVDHGARSGVFTDRIVCSSSHERSLPTPRWPAAFPVP